MSEREDGIVDPEHTDVRRQVILSRLLVAGVCAAVVLVGVLVLNLLSTISGLNDKNHAQEQTNKRQSARIDQLTRTLHQAHVPVPPAPGSTTTVVVPGGSTPPSSSGRTPSPAPQPQPQPAPSPSRSPSPSPPPLVKVCVRPIGCPLQPQTQSFPPARLRAGRVWAV